jgi:CheY-like chemotaxis protein
MERVTHKHRVKLLGELQVFSGAGELVPVHTDRVMQSLLVVMALRAGQPRSPEELVAAIWPGASGFNRGPKNLEAPVSRLRNKLGMPIPLRRGRSFYRLDLARHEVDALDFIDSVRADHIATPDIGRLIALWRGDPRVIFGELDLHEWDVLMQAKDTFAKHLQRVPPSEVPQLRSALDSFAELFPEIATTVRPQPPVMARHKPRVLIVENEENVAQMLASILFDYQTIIAVTVKEAMQIIDEQLDDLDGALVDLHLTDHRDSAGLEILSCIRDRRPELPRLLITASPNEGSQEQLRRTFGIVDTLVKGSHGYGASGVRDAVKLMFDSSDDATRRRAAARFESHAIQVRRALVGSTVKANRGIRLGHQASYRDLERFAARLEEFERDCDEARLRLSEAPVPDLDHFLDSFVDRWPVTVPSAEADV